MERFECHKKIWRKIEQRKPDWMIGNLNMGCSNDEIDMIEEKLQCTFPFDIRASWCIYNGESQSQFVGAVGSHGDPGLLHSQCRILSMQEIAEQNCDFIENCIVYGKSNWVNPLNSNQMKLIPLTTFNAAQYCVEVGSGAIYVRSGKYTMYYMKDSWLEFLYEIVDVSTVKKQFPEAPY